MRVIKLDNDLKATIIDYDKNVPQFSHKQVGLEFHYPKLSFSTVSVVYKTRVESVEEILSVDSETTTEYISNWLLPQFATQYSGELKCWLVLKTLDGNDDVLKIEYSSTIILNIVKGAIGDADAEDITPSVVDDINAILTAFGTRLTADELTISQHTTEIDTLKYYTDLDNSSTTINWVMADKHQKTWTQNITSAILTLPTPLSQGYMSIASYQTAAGSSLVFTNGNPKIVLNGRLKSETSFNFATHVSVRVVAIYDGLFQWIYIRTFDL